MNECADATCLVCLGSYNHELAAADKTGMPMLQQVLLDENSKAYVADIGLGKMLVGQDVLASAATFFWAAPEQLQVLNTEPHPPPATLLPFSPKVCLPRSLLTILTYARRSASYSMLV